MNEIEEYYYLALTFQKIEKYNLSLDYIYKIIKLNLNINIEIRTLFGSVIKSLIDKYRNDIKILIHYLENENNLFKNEKLNEIILKIRNELEKVCIYGLEIINECLKLKNLEIDTIIYFKKFSADIYRYRCEQFIDNEEFIEKSMNIYKNCLDLCEKNLPLEDNIYLGIILNYSVFCVEILQNYELAIELINNTLSKISICYDDDSNLILEIMKSNLLIWNKEN